MWIHFLAKKSEFFLFLIWQSAFVGAIAIGDLIKSTLGPKGMVNQKKIYLFKFKWDQSFIWEKSQGAGQNSRHFILWKQIAFNYSEQYYPWFQFGWEPVVDR